MKNTRYIISGRIAFYALLGILILCTTGCSTRYINSGDIKMVHKSQTEVAEEKARAEAAAKARAEEEAAAKAWAEKLAKKEKEATAEFYSKLLPGLNWTDKELRDTSYNFLVENTNLFPAKTDDDKVKLADFTDSAIKYKHLAKNVDPYLETLVNVNGKIIYIEEDQYYGRSKQSIILLLSNSNESYLILYNGSVDAFKGDMIKCTGLPVAMSENFYVNVGVEGSVVLIGCTVSKI